MLNNQIPLYIQVPAATEQAQKAISDLKEAIVLVLKEVGRCLDPTDICRNLEIYQEFKSTGGKNTQWSNAPIVYCILEMMRLEGQVKRCEESTGKWELNN